MILKQKNSALENDTNKVYVLRKHKEITPIALFLLKKKADGLLKGLLIPDSFIAEIESYVHRNNVTTPNNGEFHAMCPHCLKAHALKKAIDHGLDSSTRKYVNKILEGDNGHNGYYLDRDNLVKIQ